MAMKSLSHLGCMTYVLSVRLYVESQWPVACFSFLDVCGDNISVFIFLVLSEYVTHESPKSTDAKWG